MFASLFNKASAIEWARWRELTDFASDVGTGSALAMITLLLMSRRQRETIDFPVVIQRRELAVLLGWIAATRLADVAARGSEWFGVMAGGLRITMMVVAVMMAVVIWRRCRWFDRGATE